MDISRKIFKTSLILAGILAIGTAGYVVIEGWGFFDALYMTVITLATVGYGETHPLSTAGRAFTIVLILSGISILLYAVSAITSFFIEGEIGKIFTRRRLMKEISRLQDHYLVCGAGRIGTHIIEELSKTGREFVVVDINPEAVNRCGVFARGEKDVLFVKGDASDENTLIQAGLERAAGLFAVLPSDEDNLFLIITVRQVSKKVKIVTKSVNDSSVKKLYAAGADVVIQPGLIGGLRMVSEMTRPAATNFLDIMLKEGKGDMRVEEIEVKSDDIKFVPSEKIKNAVCLLVAISGKNNDYRFNPPDDAPVNKGDCLIVIGTTGKLLELRKII